jgi:hypothetical protein
VLATAVILMSLMMGLGLAAFSLVDSQTRESGNERIRESSFNVGEGLLGAQVFILSREWPKGNPAVDATMPNYPSSCGPGVTHPLCPDAQQLTEAFGGPDVAKGVQWETRVRDNWLDPPVAGGCQAGGGGTPGYYTDARMADAPRWDSNGDCRVWVRASATIDGKRRTMIGLVRVEQVAEQFPNNTLTAGKFRTLSAGAQTYIDTQGPTLGQPGAVAVRCTTSDDSCTDYEASRDQVKPNVVERGFTGSALSPEALRRFEDTATVRDPASCDKLAGKVVYFKTANLNCTANANYNSPSSPGILIIENGSLILNGTINFYGVIYLGNAQGSSDYILTLRGNTQVFGSVAVDGNGGVQIGDSKLNLIYNPSVFSHLVSFGNAGIIQNTWREIRG